jgi:hypothetical protein
MHFVIPLGIWLGATATAFAQTYDYAIGAYQISFMSRLLNLPQLAAGLLVWSSQDDFPKIRMSLLSCLKQAIGMLSQSGSQANTDQGLCSGFDKYNSPFQLHET